MDVFTRLLNALLWLLLAAACSRSDLVTGDGSAPSSTAGSAEEWIRACPYGFSECDGDAATPCETETASSGQHCGACGQRCPDGLFCGAGSCREAHEVVAIDASSLAMCALTAEGSVWCWGWNRGGALLGVASPNDYEATPQRLEFDERVVEVSMGEHACARTESGAIWCWGPSPRGNPLGTLPDGDSAIPVRAYTIEGPAQLAIAEWATLVLQRAGTIVGWGSNQEYQLGNQTAEGGSTEPTAAVGVPTAIQLSTDSASCALSRSGEVWCWGPAFRGVTGRSEGDWRIPTRVPGINNRVQRVQTGQLGDTCIVDDDRAAWCWGIGGALSQVSGDTIDPVQIPGLHDVVGIDSTYRHGCAVESSGFVKCWGADFDSGFTWTEPFEGMLGQGEPVAPSETPLQVVGLTNIVRITAGSGFTCALSADGRVFCWGGNEFGQLGNGTTEVAYSPVEVVGLE